MNETTTDDWDDEEPGPCVCECCDKEEFDLLKVEGAWISVHIINGDLAVDVCDECAKSDEKLRAALDAFIAAYREPSEKLVAESSRR